MDLFMKDNLKTIELQDMVSLNGKTAIFTRDFFIKKKQIIKANINSKTEIFMKDNLKTAN